MEVQLHLEVHLEGPKGVQLYLQVKLCLLNGCAQGVLLHLQLHLQGLVGPKEGVRLYLQVQLCLVDEGTVAPANALGGPKGSPVVPPSAIAPGRWGHTGSPVAFASALGGPKESPVAPANAIAPSR